MGAFVAAMARGATMEEAAREAKVAVATLYYRRRTCPAFAAAWAEAAAASAGPLLVFGRGGRRWQLVRARRLRPFCRARKQAFLDRFAESCNLAAAAATSGCSPGTVYRHLRMDGAFAAGFEAALEEGYARLQAEALRARLAAQEAYRLAPDADPAAAAHEFERTIQLLREYKRGHGKIGRRPTGGRLTKWSFDEAFEALEKELKIFGYRAGIGAAPDAEEAEPKAARSG
jgi:AcrR family transcriptional regulator